MSWPIFSQRRRDRELAEEMRAHLDEKIAELVAGGMPEEEARYEAQRQFGNTLLLCEQSRDAWGWRWLETLRASAWRWARRRKTYCGWYWGKVFALR